MVNYENSIVYKLCCKDPEIKDIYVGSTTNFRRRKCNHKSVCNNENSKLYNLYVYQFIRKNGGFSNWDMIEIEKYLASDKQDLCSRERYWVEKLNSKLNIISPTENIEKRKERESQYNKKYYQENKDKIKENTKKYKEENREILSEKGREYSNKHREKISKNSKKYYKENKEVLIDYQKNYRKENREKIREKRAVYYQKNKEIIKKKAIEKYYAKKDKS